LALTKTSAPPPEQLRTDSANPLWKGKRMDSDKISRRAFVRNSSLVAADSFAGSLLGNGCKTAKQSDTSRILNYHQKMGYRRLEKTELMISEVSLAGHWKNRNGGRYWDQFAIFDIDDNTKKVINRKDETPPAHEPGVLPQWLHENNVSVIIAGGMARRTQQLFAQNDIKVVIGAPSGTPEELVSAYLQDTLQIRDNISDH